MSLISPQAIVAKSAKVHPTAVIGPDVELGDNVVIGPYSVLGPSGEGQSGTTHIGAGTHVGCFARIEPHVRIAPQCLIEDHAVIRAGADIGQETLVGLRTTVMGNCAVGRNVVLLAEVHVCQFARVHDHCQIMPGCILLNDPYPPTGLVVSGPEIGECAILGAGAIVYPGVHMGYHSMAATLSEVKHNVQDYMLVRGRPAEVVCDVRRIRIKHKGQYVYPYPWMRHGIPGDDPTKCLL